MVLAHCHLPRNARSMRVWGFPSLAARMVKQQRNARSRGVPVAAGKSRACVLSPNRKPVLTHSSVAEGEKIFAMLCKAEESGCRWRLRIAKIGLAIRDPPGGGLTRGTGSRGCTIRRTLRIALDFRRWECYLSAITYFCHERAMPYRWMQA
jgi:hypothetical protein